MAMYDINELKELINTVDKSGIVKFELKNADGEKLLISKEEKVTCISSPVSATAEAPVAVLAPASAVTASENTAVAEADKDDDNSSAITAPMVGVFYAAPSPDAEPYVSVGSAVKKGDVICIIEAMKLMNEVTATQSGVITEICANNGEIVEFGQPLFKIK
ncbi:MAG: acetyl-CoA carboxylase biotin carboxyl carrier protein [Acutalibacteraceae bacterium]